jgi:hypothetical protein
MTHTEQPNLKVGDQVRCLKKVTFITGGAHLPNDILEIKEDTLAYYEIMVDRKYYEMCK